MEHITENIETKNPKNKTHEFVFRINILTSVFLFLWFFVFVYFLSFFLVEFAVCESIKPKRNARNPKKIHSVNNFPLVWSLVFITCTRYFHFLFFFHSPSSAHNENYVFSFFLSLLFIFFHLNLVEVDARFYFKWFEINVYQDSKP